MKFHVGEAFAPLIISEKFKISHDTGPFYRMGACALHNAYRRRNYSRLPFAPTFIPPPGRRSRGNDQDKQTPADCR